MHVFRAHFYKDYRLTPSLCQYRKNGVNTQQELILNTVLTGYSNTQYNIGYNILMSIEI